MCRGMVLRPVLLPESLDARLRGLERSEGIAAAALVRAAVSSRLREALSPAGPAIVPAAPGGRGFPEVLRRVYLSAEDDAGLGALSSRVGSGRNRLVQAAVRDRLDFWTRCGRRSVQADAAAAPLLMGTPIASAAW